MSEVVHFIHISEQIQLNRGKLLFYVREPAHLSSCEFISVYYFFLLSVGWDLRHQVLRPFMAYCTAPNDR
jgi:hypothetical protein